MDDLDLSIIISDMSHGIGVLVGIQKMLVLLKPEEIDLEKLRKVIAETQRRLSSAQGQLIIASLKVDQNEDNNRS